MERKITKKDVLVALKAVVEVTDLDFGTEVTKDDVLEYIDKTVAQLDAKTAKAKERAAEKKEEGDALRAVVLEQIGPDALTIPEITAKVQAVEGYEDVTRAKVQARLTQLVKGAEIFRGQIKKEDGKKAVVFATEAFED